jgi:phosphoribosylglycinamide formyltransferase-1
MTRLKLGVLISGRGSNLQALLDRAADPAYPAEVAVVISNNADALGLQRAEAAGAPTATIDHRGFADRQAFEAKLDEALTEAGAELVCLAGFMRKLTPWFVERWRDRLINIHPSLLPAFRGLDTHKRALEAGVRITGCTVHFVRAEVDDGPIVAQAAVPIAPDDTEETLNARVLAAEHRLYPLAVRLIAEGNVVVVGERVSLKTDAPLAPPLFSPPIRTAT